MNWFLSNPVSSKTEEMKKVTKALLYQLRHGAAADGSKVDLSSFFKHGTLVEIDKWATGDGGKAFRDAVTGEKRRYPPQQQRLRAGLKYLLGTIFYEHMWGDGHREELAGFFKRNTLLRAIKLSGYKL